MKTRRRQPGRQRVRAGLAPLELVLSLPIILFVFALIVNFGNVAVWKVRAEANAHYSLFREIHTRTGNNDPNPFNWRVNNASLSNGGGAAISQVDNYWDASPDPNTPVIRGPAIVAPSTGDSIRVVRDLQMRDGMHSGSASLERGFPMLRSMLRNNGQFDIDLNLSLLDNSWQFHSLGLGTNSAARARGGQSRGGSNQSGWYVLEPYQLPAPVPALDAQLQTAHQNLMANPLKAALDVLDRDEEYRILARRDLPRDFHPQPNTRPCGGNAIVIRDDLVRRITRLPYDMARAHIVAHEAEIRRIDDEIQTLQNTNPPPPNLNQQIQTLNAERQQHLNEIAKYQDFIDNLSSFVVP